MEEQPVFVDNQVCLKGDCNAVAVAMVNDADTQVVWCVEGHVTVQHHLDVRHVYTFSQDVRH